MFAESILFSSGHIMGDFLGEFARDDKAFEIDLSVFGSFECDLDLMNDVFQLQSTQDISGIMDDTPTSPPVCTPTCSPSVGNSSALPIEESSFIGMEGFDLEKFCCDMKNIEQSGLFTLESLHRIEYLLNTCETAQKRLQEWFSTVQLQQQGLAYFVQVEKRLKVRKAILALWREENDLILKRQNQICARLYIDDDALVDVFIMARKKATSRKSNEAQVTLLLGRNHPKFHGSVVASLENISSFKTLEECKKELNHEGVALFNDFQFKIPSKQESVCLNFKATVAFENIKTQMTYEAKSRPFIISSHQNQWEGSVGRLLFESLFADSKRISRCEFQNKIHLGYLKATRQQFKNIERPLTGRELDYLFRAANGNTHVESISFGDFWKWYGTVLREIRYNKLVNKMWRGGDLLGFISTNDVSGVIKNTGEFLFRFSESVPGMLAIAYMDATNLTQHIAVEVSALPRVIEEMKGCQALRVLVTIKERIELGSNLPALHTITKEAFIQKYGSKTTHKVAPGYSPLQTLKRQKINPYGIQSFSDMLLE